MTTQCLKIIVFAAICGVLGSVVGGEAVAAEKLRVNWTAISGAMSGVWAAEEGGFFKKEGLNVELIHVTSSSKVLQAMLAGEIEATTVDPLTLVNSVVRGGDAVIVAAITNRFGFSIIAASNIARGEDLKGKRIGITRFGSSTHTAARYAVASWGLDPDRDVSFLQFQEVPAILAGLQAGHIDAGSVSPPTNSRAVRLGFRELINLGKDGPEYPSVAFAVKRSLLTTNEDSVRRLVRAYTQGIARFLKDKAFGIELLKKYARVTDPDVLEDTYAQFSQFIERVPYVSKAGLQRVVDEVAAQEPKAKGAKPEDFMDMRFIQELEKSGFFKRTSTGS